MSITEARTVDLKEVSWHNAWATLQQGPSPLRVIEDEIVEPEFVRRVRDFRVHHNIALGPQLTEGKAMAPVVSAIVIAYNEERRIGPCLDALLSQDTPDEYEVVVIDDGSSDATANIVEQRQRHSRNLRLLSHATNRGRGAARRTGQDASDSPWIAFVDADIIVPPNWLRRCMAELSSASGVSGIALPDGDSAVIWRLSQATLRDRPGSAEITGNNVLFSRNALNQVPFSPAARLGEDFRLAKLMKAHGFELRTVTDLKVLHLESKTYWQSITWMWKSGVDATSLLFEFRVVRLPDIAWATWLAGSCAVVVAALLGVLGAGQTVALVVALTLVVDVSFVFSRFKPSPHPMRFSLRSCSAHLCCWRT